MLCTYSLEAITQEMSDSGKTGFLKVLHVQVMPKKKLLYDTPVQKPPSLAQLQHHEPPQGAFDGIKWE